MSFNTFRALVVSAASRMLLESSPPSPAKGSAAAEAIPGGPHWRIESLFRPSGQLGGDWLGGDLRDDGTVWVLIADVCGKGYAASILARGLPLLWRIRPANELRGRKCKPVELLDLLGRELNCCLPSDVFVEATAARLDPSGQVFVGAAGATRVIYRQRGARSISLQHFGGPYLGIDIPVDRSQQSWQVDPGDELLLATDGFYDQPTDNGRLAENLAELDAHLHESSLLSAANALLNRIWAEHRQFDDTTLVWIKRIL
jgi:serine phosphatase RsbU (regulator of sigma subunit)